MKRVSRLEILTREPHAFCPGVETVRFTVNWREYVAVIATDERARFVAHINAERRSNYDGTRSYVKLPAGSKRQVIERALLEATR